MPFVYQVRKEKGSGQSEIVLMGLNALIAFGYGYSLIKGLYGLAWVSVITVLYAFIFLSLATYLFLGPAEPLFHRAQGPGTSLALFRQPANQAAGLRHQ